MIRGILSRVHLRVPRPGKLARSWGTMSKPVPYVKGRRTISKHCPEHCVRDRSSICQTLATWTPMCSEHKSWDMKFPAGHVSAILMKDQEEIVADSNGCMITRIYLVTRRDKYIFIFEMSQKSEKVLSAFYHFKTFRGWLERHYYVHWNLRSPAGVQDHTEKTWHIREKLTNIIGVRARGNAIVLP
jgi:hypothetical protein